MGILKDILSSIGAGFAVVIGITAGASAALNKYKAGKIKDSPWRCVYDGLRFPSEDCLIQHILHNYRPATPNDPRRNPSPAPMVFLHRIPNPHFSGVGDAYGLWRILIHKEREGKSPMFTLEQLKWYFTPAMRWELEWLVGWCGKGKIEIATKSGGPWSKRGVTCRAEGEFPVGGFTLTASPTLDGYVRIPELGLGPTLIYKGRK